MQMLFVSGEYKATAPRHRRTYQQALLRPPSLAAALVNALTFWLQAFSLSSSSLAVEEGTEVLQFSFPVDPEYLLETSWNR